MDAAAGTRGALVRLEDNRPRLVRALIQAEANRVEHLSNLAGGARFKGLEELLLHLDAIEEYFRESEPLQNLAFLVRRTTSDIETALEATLSGYLSVAADAMRDVMEIEMLLLDFALDWTRVDEWLTANRRERLRHFRPAVLRERLRAAGAGRFGSPSDDVDYRAHSEALHVSPRRSPIQPGLADPGHGFGHDMGFWEIYEHARRVLIAIDGCIECCARMGDRTLKPNPAPTSALSSFEDGWQRTQEMQTIFVALIQATLEISDENEAAELET